MRVQLELTQYQYDNVWAHLLPPNVKEESAAFLFVEAITSEGKTTFHVKDIFYAEDNHFAHRYEDFLELSDQTRQELIKKAHSLEASIIEMHSHPFPGEWAVAFSVSDRMGLRETVPHMWWRLKNKPYGAIVVSPRGFDALVWLDNPHVPQALDAVKIEDKILIPTNRSLGGWDDTEKRAFR